MLFSTLVLFSAGFTAGLGIWWLSLDRRRGKEVRTLARAYQLQVEAVHEAAVRALRYGFAEDFTFLVSTAHPSPDRKNGTVLRPAWRRGLNDHPRVVEDDHNGQ